MLPIRLFISFIFLVIISSVFAQPTYAVCTLEVTPSVLDANFDGTITITSTGGNCFSTAPNFQYWIIAYPNKSPYPRGLFKGDKYPPSRPAVASSPTTISTRIRINVIPKQPLNDFKGVNGRDHPGEWIFAVCNPESGDFQDCYNETYFLGTAKATVEQDTTPPTPTITPTPLPSDLPIIDRYTQDTCAFQAGTAVDIKRITNMLSNQQYIWWWEGEWFDRNDRIFTNPNRTETGFTIPATATTRQGIFKFCIDLYSHGLTRGCNQNSVQLWFTAGQPNPEQSSCTIVNTTPTPTPSPTPILPTPTPPLPPCSKIVRVADGVDVTDEVREDMRNGRPLDPNRRLKCAAIDTALVTIQTDPVNFIKSLFGILLSLAGGVALLLIIGSGYKIMTSQGNQEKLQEARDTITSAIVGLLFIILSMVILEVIGVDILRIPGFQ